MKRLLLLIPILALAACGQPHIEFPKPPPEKLVCPDEPAVPPAPVTDEANGEYLRKLRGAWAGCKADVDWLRAWFDELNR